MNQQNTNRTIPVHDLGAHHGRPHVSIANADARNINARFVLARLAAFLSAMDSGDGDTRGRLCRRVLVMPSLGPETLDEAMCAHARSAWYHVELGPGEPGMDALPQVLFPQPPTDDERASACLFGLPAVTEPERNGTDLPAGAPWTSRWSGAPGEHFLIQAGHVDDLQPLPCERLFRALVAFLLHVEAISGITLAEEEDDLHYFSADGVFRLANQHAGLFVYRQDPGHWLQAGDLLGYVYNERDGSLAAEVRSPVAGLLTGLRRNPLVENGTLLAVIHRPSGS